MSKPALLPDLQAQGVDPKGKPGGVLANDAAAAWADFPAAPGPARHEVSPGSMPPPGTGPVAAEIAAG